MIKAPTTPRAAHRKHGAPARAKALVWVVAVLCLAGFAGAMIATTLPRQNKAAMTPVEPHVSSLRIVPGTSSTLELTGQLVHSLGVRAVEVKTAASHDRLNLSGSLFLDSNRMVRVHSRFAGEVVSIGTVDPNNNRDQHTSARPLRLGDHVTKGQLLAVIWSREVGEKKSDLVNALSKLMLDDAQLKSLQALGKDVVAEQQVREAKREREADVIEVDRVERTLRSWRLTTAEIDVVRAEAEKIHRGDTAGDLDIDKSWAELEVRSPFDGIILEKNVVAGDIVDTTLDLFRIADLRVLGVMANVYEEDLPVLEALRPTERRWTVSFKSRAGAPGIPGAFDLIGSIVDPNQHTAAVMGWLDNHDGRLRAGQFITATVDLPAKDGEVVIPDAAVIEGATYGVVFVASDETARQVTRRQVALVSRGQDVAYVRSQPTPEESANGCQSLTAGEWVVTAGSIELDGALDNALATRPQHEPLTN